MFEIDFISTQLLRYINTLDTYVCISLKKVTFRRTVCDFPTILNRAIHVQFL